jgi:hypothetical protein
MAGVSNTLPNGVYAAPIMDTPRHHLFFTLIYRPPFEYLQTTIVLYIKDIPVSTNDNQLFEILWTLIICGVYPVRNNAPLLCSGVRF